MTSGSTPEEGFGPKRAAERLLRAVAKIHARGWCPGTSGNYSVTVDRDPLRLLVTRSGVDKGEIGPEDLLLVDGEGRPGQGAARPSAEVLLHAALAREARAGAILHTHSVWGTLAGERHLARGGLDLTGYEMLKGIEGVRSHEERLHVPVLENSQDMEALAGQAGRIVREEPAARGFLIAGHGLYAWGGSVEEAFRHVEVFEFLFEVTGRRAGG